VHRFPCRRCGEDIEVALEANYETFETRTVAVTNAVLSENIWGDEIVNLDPEFVVPAAYQGKDKVFSRLPQMHAMVKKAEELGVLPPPMSVDDPRWTLRPFRRQDYLTEWNDLKRAWALRRRGQEVLSRGIVRKISGKMYSDRPLRGLEEWVYRFTLQVQGRASSEALTGAMARVEEAMVLPDFEGFRASYTPAFADRRGRRYLAILSEYFGGYSEFSQVQSLVTGGLISPGDHAVSSTNFDAVRMFYGNAFETLADQLDVIAMINNLLQGRRYDTFAQLSMDQYYKLDKSGRANCFAADPALASFAHEFDNQVRNASHHGGMEFDPASQIITYRSGKGGTGPEQQMTYTTYLTRSVAMLSQLLRLFTAELLLTKRANLNPPL
jgi:hypothetical protein